MGAWGYKVYDNDDAGGLYITLTESKNVSDVVKRVIKRKEPNEIRAVAQFLASIREYVESPELFIEHISLAAEELERLLENEEFIEDWDDTRAIKRELRKEIKNVEI